MLFGRNGGRDDLIVRGARVVDPGEGIDAVLDVIVDQGVISRLESPDPSRSENACGPSAKLLKVLRLL